MSVNVPLRRFNRSDGAADIIPLFTKRRLVKCHPRLCFRSLIGDGADPPRLKCHKIGVLIACGSHLRGEAPFLPPSLQMSCDFVQFCKWIGPSLGGVQISPSRLKKTTTTKQQPQKKKRTQVFLSWRWVRGLRTACEEAAAARGRRRRRFNPKTRALHLMYGTQAGKEKRRRRQEARGWKSYFYPPPCSLSREETGELF